MVIEGPPLTERETTLTVANMRQVRNWSLNDLSFELPHNIMASIDSVYFPRFAISFDHISWGLTETGIFSVKSCFTELKKLTNLELQLNSTTNVEFSWIWGMHLSLKLKQFLWLLNHGRLSTSSFLHSINIIQSPLCVLCDLRVEETCAHLFLLCPKLASLWSELINKLIHWVLLLCWKFQFGCLAL